MKGKHWASWLLAGLVVVGNAPTVAATTVPQTPAPPPAIEGAAVPANGTVVLTRAAARKELLALPAVGQASRAEQDAYDNWRNAVARAEQLDTEKMKFENPWTGKTETIVYNDLTQMRLRQQKYILPDQLKLAADMASATTTLTILTLENALDGQLLGLYAAQEDVASGKRDLTLAEEALVRTKALLAAGRVTQSDVDDATLAVRKAQAALNASQRTLENRIRSYNRFAGAPVGRRISVSPDVSGVLPLLNADDYVVQALQNRMEIRRQRANIQLLERTLESLTFRDLHKFDTDITSEYAKTALDLQKARLELTETQRAITAEIRAGMIELRIAQLDLESMKRSLATQREKLASMKVQIDAGRLAAWADDALQSAVASLESGVRTSTISLDNAVRRFRQAAGTGPSLEGR